MHRLRLLPGALCALVLALGGCLAPASAQVLYGSLVGTIEDQTGASIPKAAVSITDPATGVTRQTVTDDAGRYSFANVQPGTYEIKVTSPGFRTLTQSGIGISANNVSRTDLKLEVGQVNEEVTVQGQAVALQTDKADTHTDLGTRIVETMPLNQYRNYQALINLVPGATPAEFQNSATDTPARSLRTYVNGTAPNTNNTRLDGAADVNIWLPHHAMYVAPSETIETVNIASSSFDAEQGMAGGAAITVITKSGTNELHGSAFEYHNNQHLRARNFFLQPGTDKPRDTLNIFGGTVGGKIIRDKLFYFGSFEGTRQRQGGSGFFTVPNMDIRSGNFSAYPTVIYDPRTGNPDGTGRLPFPGNIIPPDRLSPIAQKIFSFMPPPNLAGATNNFFTAATGKFDRENYDVKVNYNRNERHMIWGKYSRLNANVTGIGAFGQLIGNSVVNDPGTGHTVVQVPTIGHTYTFSPTLLLDQSLGFTRMNQNVLGTDFGKNWGTDVFGIPGTNGPDIRQSGLPIFNFSNAPNSTIGLPATWMPLFRIDESWTHSSNVTWTHRSHELRFGFDLIRHHLNHWQPEIGGGPRGWFNFTGGATALKGGASPDQNNSYADFMLGLPNQMQKSIQYLLMTGREWQFGWYARDRWQATRKLTLNLGMRIEHYPLMTRAGSGIERLDLNTMNVLLGGRGSVPQNAGISVNTPLWAPRVGLAYRATDTTVIRAGYGLTWDPLPYSRPLRGWYPLTINGSFVGASDYTPVSPLASGIPPVTGPDLSTGIVPLPPNVDERSPYSYIHRGYIQSWNFTLERNLPGHIVGSVAYVGTQTTHQLADLDINAAAPGAGSTGRPLYSQWGRNIALNMWDGYLSAHYHSLQATINRQFSNGLLLKGAYTFSKAINMTDEDGWAGVMWNWGPAFYRNQSLASYDRTHIFQLAWMYQLPFGKGKKYFTAGTMSKLLGDWQVNGINYAYSGTPFTVSASGASLNAPGNSQTADQVSLNVAKPNGIGPGQPYYDPAAFAPVTAVRFGSTGRNALRGPGVVGMDGSVFRTFPVNERVNVEFRAEAFNVTNTPRFSNPNANVSNAATFMQITSTRFDSDRQFRFGLRLGF